MRATKWVGAVALASALVVTGCSGSDDADGLGQFDGGSVTEHEAYGGGFTMLSYNVAGLPAEISSVRPDLHLPMISPRLNDYELVLTQEDFDWWQGFTENLDFVNYHDRLRADATHEFSTDRHPGPEAVGLDLTNRMAPLVGDGLGVLSRFALGPTDRVPWDDCFGGLNTSDGGAADCASMKGFSMTPLTLPDGDIVHVYNLHAEAGGTETDQALQVDNFDKLATYIETHSDGVAIILGGDTNLHTNSDHPDASGDADTTIWAEFLERTGLVDTCDIMKSTEPSSIDKVAVRGSDQLSLTATSWDFVRGDFLNDAGEDLSDHPPVAVNIAWERRS